MIYNHYEQSILEATEMPQTMIELKAFEQPEEILVIQKVISHLDKNMTPEKAIELVKEETQLSPWRVGMIEYDFSCPLQFKIMDEQVLDAYGVDGLVIMDMISLVQMDKGIIELLHRYKRYTNYYLCPNAFRYQANKNLREHMMDKQFAYYPLTLIKSHKKMPFTAENWRFTLPLEHIYQRFIREKSSRFH